MKYLKTFESSNNSLKISKGDYVVVDKNYFVDKKEKYGKIIKNEDSYTFLVLLPNGYDIWCQYHMFIRKMNTKEIEQFEFELEKNKYNL